MKRKIRREKNREEKKKEESDYFCLCWIKENVQGKKNGKCLKPKQQSSIV